MSNYSFKWLVQRITATLLVPLTFWFVYHCILFSKISYKELIIFFSSYLNSVIFLIMIISMIIHTILGCETIIEDYVSSSKLKNITMFFIRITFYSSIIIAIISILSILSKA